MNENSCPFTKKSTNNLRPLSKHMNILSLDQLLTIFWSYYFLPFEKEHTETNFSIVEDKKNGKRNNVQSII